VIISGIATITIHAPSVNFVSTTTTITTNVQAAPIPLIGARQCQPSPCVRSQ